MYKTFVIDYHPKAGDMAAEIEKLANEISDQYDVVSVTVTPSAKGIVLAKEKEQ